MKEKVPSRKADASTSLKKSKPFFQTGISETPFFQAKLRLGSPDDPLEHEADRIADVVVGGNEIPDVQTKRPGAENGSLSPEFERKVSTLRAKGEALPSETRTSMEQGFGADFGEVRIHKGKESSGLNKQIQARAFTHGNDIFFDKGEYQPQTKDGQRLIAHELTHTIQQGGSQYIRRSLSGLSQDVRNNVSLWNVRVEPSHVGSGIFHDYFKKNPPNASIGFGGTIVIDPSVTQTTDQEHSTEYDVARGLQSVPGHFVSSLSMPVNSTATIHLDFSSFGGQVGTFRITYVNTNTGEGDATREFHIEFLGGAHTTAEQSSRPEGITVRGNTFTADGWPDAQYDQLVETLNRIPASALSQINGMTFNYRSGTTIAHGQVMTEEGEAELEYGIPTTDRVITIFGSAAAPNAMNYEGLPRIAWVIAHEIGHWLDFMPIFNVVANATSATVTPTHSLSGHTRIAANGDLETEAGGNTRFHRLNNANTGISAYGGTNSEESFAEYFAMYITSPATLLLLRPAMHAYFAREFP
jgi:hypothetical protein